MFISGALIHFAVIIIMLIWRPDYHMVWVFYVVAALLGYCDAVWQTQINGKSKTNDVPIVTRVLSRE